VDSENTKTEDQLDRFPLLVQTFRITDVVFAHLLINKCGRERKGGERKNIEKRKAREEKYEGEEITYPHQILIFEDQCLDTGALNSLIILHHNI
jgi:hypothetical protein